MRRCLAMLAILAGSSAAAAGLPPEFDPDGTIARTQAVARCLSVQLPAIDFGSGPEDPSGDCECAVGRLDAAELAAAGTGDDDKRLGQAFESCRAERLERRTAGDGSKPAATATATADKPPADAAATGDGARPAFAVFDRLGEFAMPRWGWIAIPGVALAIGLLVLFGRRRTRKHLDRPPDWMRSHLSAERPPTDRPEL